MAGELNELNLKKAERNRFIDVLKGIAIIFVIVTHFNWTSEKMNQLLFPFWINMAVPVFMILSGYVYQKSYEKNNITTFEQAYEWKNVLHKLVRYTVPFAIAFILEMILCYIQGSLTSPAWIVIMFIAGGMGPGSYYYPIMIQFIFVFPAIYFCIKKYKFKGVILCGVLNLTYEIMQRSYGMNAQCYRFLMFRYLLLIAFGCYLATEGKIKKAWLWGIISMLVGAIYIVTVSYLEYEPKIFWHWKDTCVVAVLFIIPIIAFLIGKCKKMKFAPLEFLGKASYNIFLVQMIYYMFFDYKYNFNTTEIVHLLYNILVCVGIGILFYLVEAPITRYINEKINGLLDKGL